VGEESGWPRPRWLTLQLRVRGALKKAARERSTTSWSQLRRQLGSPLPSLHTYDQVEVLVTVDAPPRANPS
jgi:hypothetical protein